MMTIINKTFAIGDTYRGTRGDLFTVTATGTRKINGTHRTSTAPSRTRAARLTNSTFPTHSASCSPRHKRFSQVHP